MKTRVKFVVYMMIIVASMMLVACASNRYSVEESKNNFEGYAEKLSIIADSFGFVLQEKESSIYYEPDDKYICMVYSIEISSDDRIEITLSNYPERRNKGTEEFTIEYTKNENVSDYQIDLFVALVNTVSGKSISESYCTSFLNASEEEYSAARFGYQKLNGEVIAKMDHLNFFEDWTIKYLLYGDGAETLMFGGIIN